MVQSKERPFEDVALKNGWVTEVQVTECLQLQKKATEIGLREDIAEVFVKKGYLNKQQVQAIYAAQGKGTRAAIEGYEIITKIGQGGMGAVYKARQIVMDRTVAIKVLLPRYAKEKDSRERFLREARAVARLNHPNIVSGIDAGVSNNIYYYVMEYVEGTPLDKILEEKIKLPESEASKIILQVAKALDHAQKNDLIHRDIKPANIIVTKDGTVKLTDLGLARFVSDTEAFMTQTGIVIGTPHYLSPEQARGEKHLDIQSDIYSLGITFYELVTGKVPFNGESSAVIISQRLNKDVAFPPEFVKSLSSNIRAVIRKMTEREKNNRYKTPNELAEDLEAMVAGNQPLIAKPTVKIVRTQPYKQSGLPLSKRSVTIATIATGVLILLIVMVFAGKGSKTPQKVESSQEQLPVSTVNVDKEVPSNVGNAAPEQPKKSEEKTFASLPERKETSNNIFDRLYEETKEFIANNGKNPDRVVAKIESVTESLSDSPYAKQVLDEYTKFKVMLRGEVEEDAKRATAKVKSLLAEQKYGEAIKKFVDNMPKKVSSTGEELRSQKIKRFEDDTTNEATSDADKIFAEANNLSNEKKYIRARADIDKVLSFSIPELTDRATKELDKIDNEMKTQDREKLRAARQEEQLIATYFLQWMGEIRDKRNYDEALNKASKLQGDLSSDVGRRGLQDCISLISRAKGAFDTASENAALLRKDQPFSYSLRGAKGEYSYKVKQAEKGNITVAIEGGTMTIDVGQLDSATILYLYNLKQSSQSEGNREYSIGLFSLFDGDYQLAQQHLDRAKSTGVKIDERISNLLRALKSGKSFKKR